MSKTALLERINELREIALNAIYELSACAIAMTMQADCSEAEAAELLSRLTKEEQ